MGIPEDPVTGSAQSSLGPFWAQRLGRTELRARQVSARGGDIAVAVQPGGQRVKLAGKATTIVRGELVAPY
jgi:predicted PhzF superfamily epimerase YddE/YHI9